MSSSTKSRQSLAWIGIIIVLGVTMWFGLKALREAEPEIGPAGGAGGRPPSTVIVSPVEESEIVENLTVTGTLRAVHRAEVAARESAAVDSLNVDEGDLIEAGAVIAKLDTRRLEALKQEATAALTASKAELTQREAERERAVLDEEMMRGLWDERAVAEREYLDSLREMKVSEAQVNAAKEAVEVASKRFELLDVRFVDLEIKAPFSGRVVAVHTELGEWLNEGDPVITLVSTGAVEAWLQLPERKASLLKHASPESVQLRLPGRNESIKADSISVIPDVEGRSRSFNLIAHVPDPENLLIPGSSVEAIVPLGLPTKQLVISADAILKSYSGTHVYVPDTSSEGPPIAKQVPVDLLFERNGKSILVPGTLKAGDQVIVEGNERLFPGTPLDPKPWTETRGEAGNTSAR
ncbi:efflux RND transporter periplasmic adaptor subunit [Haloferula chungangensis]|uniref:Efflux RND transporter periplasmic adaptor subunit n=1 Tax=Haloferula chungangensis TaxID=1048331 RepID=A0ABW2LDN4_9BACT